MADINKERIENLKLSIKNIEGDINYHYDSATKLRKVLVEYKKKLEIFSNVKTN